MLLESHILCHGHGRERSHGRWCHFDVHTSHGNMMQRHEEVSNSRMRPSLTRQAVCRYTRLLEKRQTPVDDVSELGWSPRRCKSGVSCVRAYLPWVGGNLVPSWACGPFASPCHFLLRPWSSSSPVGTGVQAACTPATGHSDRTGSAGTGRLGLSTRSHTATTGWQDRHVREGS
jgi:hypothetical protein